MFYSNWNLYQVQDFFNQLSKLKVVEGHCNQNVFFSKTGINIQTPSNTTSQKISNYLGSWMGWNQELVQFPQLTAKVRAFVRENKEQALAIDDSVIYSSIANIGFLLHTTTRESEQAIAIQQALEDLLWVRDQLLEERKKNQSQSPTPLTPSKTPMIIAQPKSLEILSKIVYFREKKDDESLKKTIRSLLVDPELTSKKDYFLESGQKIEIPKQFLVDCNRIDRLTFNKQPLFVMMNQLNYPIPDLVQFLVQKMGQVAFDRLAALINQAFMADFVVDSFKKISPEDLAFLKGLSFTQATGYEFDIFFDGKEIHLDARICLVAEATEEEKVKATDGTEETLEKRVLLGYFMINRHLKVPFEEFKASFEGKKEDERIPHLEVLEQISDLCRTPQEAKDNLQSSFLYRYFYQKLY